MVGWGERRIQQKGKQQCFVHSQPAWEPVFALTILTLIQILFSGMSVCSCICTCTCLMLVQTSLEVQTWGKPATKLWAKPPQMHSHPHTDAWSNAAEGQRQPQPGRLHRAWWVTAYAQELRAQTRHLLQFNILHSYLKVFCGLKVTNSKEVPAVYTVLTITTHHNMVCCRLNKPKGMRSRSFKTGEETRGVASDKCMFEALWCSAISHYASFL